MALGSCCKARGFSVLHLIYKPTAVFLESRHTANNILKQAGIDKKL